LIYTYLMFVRFLYTVWCGAIVLSIPKVMRRPECRVKLIVFPHLILLIAFFGELRKVYTILL
jgi:hypothetical protein